MPAHISKIFLIQEKVSANNKINYVSKSLEDAFFAFNNLTNRCNHLIDPLAMNETVQTPTDVVTGEWNPDKVK